MNPINSKHYRSCIRTFITTFEQPIYRFLNEAPEAVKKFRAKLIEEEEKELLQATTQEDELDAYMDLIYVIEGCAVVCGLGVNVEPAQCISLMHAIDYLLDELYIPVACDKRMNSYVLACVAWIEKLCTDKGYDYLSAFNAVHSNNMAKLWTHKPAEALGYSWKAKGDKYLVTRSDGKVIKPLNHTKVDLKPFIKV